MRNLLMCSGMCDKYIIKQEREREREKKKKDSVIISIII